MSPYSAWPFLSDPNHPFLSAVWAVLIHGVIGVVCVAPLIWRSNHRVGYFVLAFIGGSVLDVDHFIAAGSLNLHTIETMSGRPATHSFLFVIVLGLLTLLVTRRWIAAWAVFAVNLTHVLFDAAGGGVRVLYPLAHPQGLPWLLCPIGILALLGISTALTGGLSRRPPSRLGRERSGVAAVG
ncbi:MAG: metal-dependent hydrolase [Solirubrobacteraceae bacterium]